jgi:type I restriction enzyme S subunit
MKEDNLKESPLGFIPIDWDVTPLGDLGEVQMCKRIFSNQTSDTGDVPFYKIGTLGKEADAYISRQLYEDYRRKYNFPLKGDLLISAAGTIGRTLVYDGSDCYYQDSNIVWLRNDEKKVSNLYLSQAFKIIKWRSQDGGTISRLYNSNFKATLCAHPISIKEQKRIYEVLSDVDGLIEATELLLQKKRNIRRGTMQQLLSGDYRLPGFNASWKTFSIEDDASVAARIGWQGLTTKEYLDSGDYFIIGGTDFNNGHINWENAKFVSYERFIQDNNIQLKLDDVLVTKDGTIGKVAFVDELPMEGTLNSGVFVVRSKKEYLYQPYLALVFLSVIFSKFIERISAGSTIKHLFQRDLVKFSFNAPNDIQEQKAIYSIILDMNDEIKYLEDNLSKYKAIREAIMQQLLTGKIRLI